MKRNPIRTQIKFVFSLVAFLLLADCQLFAQTASNGQDPFAGVHARLAEAADSSLAGLRIALEKTDSEMVQEVPSQRQVSSATVPDISLARVSAAHARFLRLRVDAARIFVEEGVPLELLVVAEIESGFDPLALSPKGARGPWQLMPTTAERFGLRVNGRTDERIHPERSTRAAARYLRELYARFDDWLLALAAYNAGEQRVANAIEKGGTRDFWQLAQQRFLPEETRRYIPAVVGTKNSRQEFSKKF